MLENELLFNSEAERGCLAVLTSLELKPGESRTYVIDMGNAVEPEYLDSGNYTFKAHLLTDDSDTVSIDFVVEKCGFLIT